MAWKQIPETAVAKRVSMCGFSDSATLRHMARHDGYSTRFCMVWESTDPTLTDIDEHSRM
ncbi:hypothetical protein GQ600_5278 [Phytophthora cactorum]|nr:hypothetical protein GQ600_5278 [Phytophthora cactorum]